MDERKEHTTPQVGQVWRAPNGTMFQINKVLPNGSCWTASLADSPIQSTGNSFMNAGWTLVSSANAASPVGGRTLSQVLEEVYPLQTHEATTTIVHGKPVMVDVGIVELIEAMNAIPGLRTVHSCQGDPWHTGYVSFQDESPYTFGAALGFLQEVLAHMALAEYGPVSGSVTLSLYFTVEVCESVFVIRWFPEMLPTLLHIVRTVSEKIRRVA